MEIREDTPEEKAYFNALPKLILLAGATLSFLGAFLGSVIVYLFCQWKGIDLKEITGNFSLESPEELRFFMRGVLLLNHLATFMIPAGFTMWMFYKSNWASQLCLNHRPANFSLLLGTLFVFSAFPFAQAIMEATIWLTKNWELLQPLIKLESSSEKLLGGLVAMKSPWELAASLLVMALVPALGEEMLFRGVFQEHLGKWIKKPMLAIFITAFMFSLAHFQVQRFLAILLLGIALGFLYYWTKNLWVSIAAHFFNNAIQVVVTYFNQDKIAALNSGDTEPLHWSATVISIFIFLASGLYLRRLHADKTEVS
jgi:hypothetical protein